MKSIFVLLQYSNKQYILDILFIFFDYVSDKSSCIKIRELKYSPSNEKMKVKKKVLLKYVHGIFFARLNMA